MMPPTSGTMRHDAAELHRVDVVDHGAAVDAEILCRARHTLTVDTEEPMPPRASEKFCLYSPRLMVWVTLLT